MRYISILCIAIYFISCRQTVPNAITKANADPYAYDSVIASKWGADVYGMKEYVLVFLKRGPNRSQDSVTRANLQQAHMANINRLAEEGRLVLAGPMNTEEEIRGIYIFDVKTIEEAKALTETDPAIQAGSLIMEMHPWYGSAALKEIPSLHKKGARIEF
jgi:uncharacterized protein